MEPLATNRPCLIWLCICPPDVLAFMFIAAEFTVIYMAFVGMFLLRHKIGAIFDNFSTIYKDSKCLIWDKYH